MHKFQCYFYDNSTKKQYFTVSANDKKTAIDKAFKKAKKSAKGDITNWDVKLIPGT